MKDVVVVVMTLGFFALCIGYVALCDRIIGPDDVESDAGESDAGGSATLTEAMVEK